MNYKRKLMVAFSGSIDLNSYFKDLSLIFGKYSANDIKTIRLNIQKSEVSPYFMNGGIFEPKEGSFFQIIGLLKKNKWHPSWYLMYYGDFVIEKN